jgi:hypothetical protein
MGGEKKCLTRFVETVERNLKNNPNALNADSRFNRFVQNVIMLHWNKSILTVHLDLKSWQLQQNTNKQQM